MLNATIMGMMLYYFAIKVQTGLLTVVMVCIANLIIQLFNLLLSTYMVAQTGATFTCCAK